MNLNTYYSGLFDLDYEEWNNISMCWSSGSIPAMPSRASSAQKFGNSSICLQQATDAQKGTYSVNITNTNITGISSTDYIVLYLFGEQTRLFTIPNKVYNVSIWLKSNQGIDGLNATINIYFQNREDFVSYGKVAFNLTQDWKEYSIGANLTYNASVSGYRIVLSGLNANESILVDNLTITQNGNELPKYSFNGNITFI